MLKHDTVAFGYIIILKKFHIPRNSFEENQYDLGTALQKFKIF